MENLSPQFMLGDFSSFLVHYAFDDQGNMYAGDGNWNRVLIYKTPFAQFDALGGGGP